MKEVEKIYYIVSEKKIGGEETPPTIEVKKKELYQEYQTKFQKISAFASTLTNQILTNLSASGYTLQKITWTGELQVPSLTNEPSVKPSLSKNK